MKLNFIFLSFLLVLLGCSDNNLLSDSEIKMCQTISFDTELVNLIKGQTQLNIQQIPLISEYGEIIKKTGNGLCSKTLEEEGTLFVLENKKAFKNNGYLLFIFDDNKSQNYLATVKGTDELDIIKWRKTNAINYNYNNEDILNRLKSWKQKQDFIITGVGADWVQFQFVDPIKDETSFAKEVYEFCPDVVEQGTGDLPALANEIKNMNGIFLWWD